MMNATNNAILLLTSHFARTTGRQDAKPLTPGEWGRFAQWLHERGQTPGRLLEDDLPVVLAGLQDKTVTLARIQALLARGHAMALALEKWSRAGIWVLTRSDKAYPQLLKQRLKAAAPAVLYGCGNEDLLNAAGVAVIGSRKASDADLADAMTLGRRIASSGYAVVSGGARGVDETAMLGGLEQEGTAAGVLADSLLQAATSRKWREGLVSRNLVLVSPYYPEAAFNSGNAMGRNKHVYCLSSAAIVVHSGDTGGTWNGAEEDLKRAWVPLWVKPTRDPNAGNARLVQMGGKWLPMPAEEFDVAKILEPMPSVLEPPPVPVEAGGLSVAEPSQEAIELEAAEREQEDVAGAWCSSLGIDPIAPDARGDAPASFYDLFLSKLEAENNSVTAKELAEAWGLHKTQVQEWLDQAVAEGVMRPSGSKSSKKYSKASADMFNAPGDNK